MENRFTRFKKDNMSIITEEEQKYKVPCKTCGRKKTFYFFEHRDYKICDWCGHTIYKDEETEKEANLNKFKHNLMKEMRK